MSQDIEWISKTEALYITDEILTEGATVSVPTRDIPSVLPDAISYVLQRMFLLKYMQQICRKHYHKGTIEVTVTDVTNPNSSQMNTYIVSVPTDEIAVNPTGRGRDWISTP